MPDVNFGPLISFYDVENALRDHLKTWLNTYLAARERKAGMTPGGIARPRSWIIRQNFTTLPDQEFTPTIVVVSNGFSDDPVSHGDGNWDVMLRMAVAALCHGPETDAARELAGHYQAAIGTFLIKHKKFGSMNAKIHEWTDLRMEDIEDEAQTRTLAVARLEFIVKVTDFALSFGALPSVPDVPEDPQPDDHTADTVDIVIQSGDPNE